MGFSLFSDMNNKLQCGDVWRWCCERQVLNLCLQVQQNQSRPVGAALRNPQQHKALCKVGGCVMGWSVDTQVHATSQRMHRNQSCLLLSSMVSYSFFIPRLSAFQATSQRPSRAGSTKSYMADEVRHTHTFNTQLLVLTQFVNCTSLQHLTSILLQVTIDDSDEDIPVMKATRPPAKYVC